MLAIACALVAAGLLTLRRRRPGGRLSPLQLE